MNIDEAAGLMDLDLTLTLYWRDDKVSINSTSTNKEKITINPEQDDLLKKIWCPDIAIDQANSSQPTSSCDFYGESLQAKSVKTAKVFLPSTAVRIDRNNNIRF